MINEPTNEQKAILNYNGNTVVTANPGSGKTYTVVEKIGKVLHDLPSYKGIIAISFEFNVVFHMDMYKYIISDELGDAEEKKQSLNLHYVGITRAIDVCYIMNGTRRYRAKYGDFYDAKPSSFLFMPGLSERRNDVRWD